MEVSEFIEQFLKESEQIVRETFPKKVLEIDEIFEQVKKENARYIEKECDDGPLAPLDDVAISADPSSKETKGEGDLNNGISSLCGSIEQITYQEFVHNYCQRVKHLLYDLKEHANKIKMWIRFLIPKIEDGNNFGVSIQEKVVDKAMGVENEVNVGLLLIAGYYLQRAKLSSKVAKYPNIKDYRRSIKEIDDMQMANLQTVILEMRNHYASLYDVIMKNVEKIKVPRTDNSQDMF